MYQIFLELATASHSLPAAKDHEMRFKTLVTKAWEKIK